MIWQMFSRDLYVSVYGLDSTPLGPNVIRKEDSLLREQERIGTTPGI
jgi:hypothetical protein